VLVISLVGGSLLVALSLALTWSERLRARAAQADAGRLAFAEHFRPRDVPDDVLTHSYDALRRRLPDAPAPVAPADQLRGEYRLSRLDVEDMALVIVARCGGRIPTGRELDDLQEDVVTVEDLVLYLTPFCRTAQLA
jgi:hypothetical protein